MSTILRVSVVDKSQQKESKSNDSPSLTPPDLRISENSLYCFIKNFIGTPSDSSAVTIDKKIEQAMDLVKSHLIFAVREEVDVLKAKIAELKEKILRLEHENGILKVYASQEVLDKISKGGIQSVSQAQFQQKTLITTHDSYQS